MKVLSLWQPYASLLIHGHKRIETRGWPAPEWIIGERIGIASTKQIKKVQRDLFRDGNFNFHYLHKTRLPLRFDDLPHGFLLGTAVVKFCKRMTEADLKRLNDRERYYGDWQVGRYAWRMIDVVRFGDPIPVKGGQRLWNYNDPIPNEAAGGTDQRGAS